MDSTEREKSPQTFVNLESRGLSHCLGSSIPLYSSARTLPQGKNLMLLHLQVLSTLVGGDIAILKCKRAFKPLQKEKGCELKHGKRFIL